MFNILYNCYNWWFYMVNDTKVDNIDYEDIYDNINDYEYPYNHINQNLM